MDTIEHLLNELQILLIKFVDSFITKNPEKACN